MISTMKLDPNSTFFLSVAKSVQTPASIMQIANQISPFMSFYNTEGNRSALQ